MPTHYHRCSAAGRIVRSSTSRFEPANETPPVPDFYSRVRAAAGVTTPPPVVTIPYPAAPHVASSSEDFTAPPVPNFIDRVLAAVKGGTR